MDINAMPVERLMAEGRKLVANSELIAMQEDLLAEMVEFNKALAQKMADQVRETKEDLRKQQQDRNRKEERPAQDEVVRRLNTRNAVMVVAVKDLKAQLQQKEAEDKVWEDVTMQLARREAELYKENEDLREKVDENEREIEALRQCNGDLFEYIEKSLMLLTEYHRGFVKSGRQIDEVTIKAKDCTERASALITDLRKEKSALKQNLEDMERQLEQRDQKLGEMSENELQLRAVVVLLLEHCLTMSEGLFERKLGLMRATDEDGKSEREELITEEDRERELEPMRATDEDSESEREELTTEEDRERELEPMRATDEDSESEWEEMTSEKERKTDLEQIAAKERERLRELEKAMATEAETQQRSHHKWWCT